MRRRQKASRSICGALLLSEACEYLTLGYKVFMAITWPSSDDQRMVSKAFLSFFRGERHSER